VAAEYQPSDWRVADYQTFCLDPSILDPATSRPLYIRGPKPPDLKPGSYFVCLGAAQTFGRFCRDPYPSLLSHRLKLPVLNISRGGAGPSFFLGDGNTRLGELINGARFVVVQVMSGRSESNSLFLSRGVGHYERRSDGRQMGCDEAYDELLASCSQEQAKRIIEETRQSWTTSYCSLLEGIKVPKILFWFAVRKPAYDEGWTTEDDQRLGGNWRNRETLFGGYPQLVNDTMVSDISRHADDYVECFSRRGMPQKLTDRFTGERVIVTDEWSTQPWTKNWYYPSPQMHEDAADVLAEQIRGLLSGERAESQWWKLGRLATRLSRHLTRRGAVAPRL